MPPPGMPPLDQQPVLPSGAKVLDSNMKEVAVSSNNTSADEDSSKQPPAAPRMPIEGPKLLPCPPGYVPPPQSLASLSTPGAGATWHYGYLPRAIRGPMMQHQYSAPNRSRNMPRNAPQGQQRGNGNRQQSQYREQNSHGSSGKDVVPDMSVPATGIAPGLSFPVVNTPPGIPQVQPHHHANRAPPSHMPGRGGNRFIPPQQQFGRNLPTGEMMKASDVKFVVSKVLQLTETQDPYNDDFYYIQTTIKKHEKRVREALDCNMPPPPPLPIPLPTWTETRERVKAEIDATRNRIENNSRLWESQEKVLGHTVRSDVSKPRAVLDLSTAEERLARCVPPDADPSAPSLFGDVDPLAPNAHELYDAGGGCEDDDEDRVNPFTTVLWNMRMAANRGFTALYTAQELHQLLMTPLVASNPMVRNEILANAQKSLALLSKCLGIKVHKPSSEIDPNSLPVIILDGALVAALLQTVKGKKLIARGLPIIPADERWTLLPVIVARILQKDPSEQSPEDAAVETTLLCTLIRFIEFEHQSITERQQHFQANHALDHTESLVMLLSHLRQCIKSVMVSQMEKSQLRKALKSSRKRAEVMNITLRLGNKITEVIDDESKKVDWWQMRDAFMLMLEN